MLTSLSASMQRRSFSLPVIPLMDPDRLADLVSDGKDGIERGHGFLEDHADAVSPGFRASRLPGAG